MIASDEQLMEAVRNNHLDQLKELFDRYERRLYNYFLRSTQHGNDSSDLTQMVFVRVLKYRGSYKAGSSFEGWIFQIARNQLMDYFKSAKRHNDRFAQVEQLPDQMADDSEEAAIEQEERLWSAMKKLPDEQRELLVLSKFEGIKYEQIAQLRATTVANVKVQVHRTIKQLRRLYFEETEV